MRRERTEAERAKTAARISKARRAGILARKPLEVNDRVKWANPEVAAGAAVPNLPLRGRITYILEPVGALRQAQVIEDGKTFGIWIPLDKLTRE